MIQFDLETGEYVSFPAVNGANGNSGLASDHMYGNTESASGLFCEGCIWILSRTGRVIKVDPQTGAMTGYVCENGVKNNSNLPDQDYIAILCCIYDGQFIWFSTNKQKIVRLDPSTGSMLGFDIPRMENAFSMAYDGDFIWITGGVGTGVSGTSILFKFNASDHSVKEYNLDDALMDTYWSCFYVDNHVWLASTTRPIAIRFNTLTEEFEQFPFVNGLNNNSNLNDDQDFPNGGIYSSVYDGKYIWIAPGFYDRVVRLDPTTGTMKGIEFVGENVGTWPDYISNIKSREITFDGKNLWIIPYCADRLLKIYTTNHTTLTITETYHSTEGDQLRDPTTTLVEEGSTYTKDFHTAGKYTGDGRREREDVGDAGKSVSAFVRCFPADRRTAGRYTVSRDDFCPVVC